MSTIVKKLIKQDKKGKKTTLPGFWLEYLVPLIETGRLADISVLFCLRFNWKEWVRE